MQFLELAAGLALLLGAMALGAIVTLRVVQSTQASSASIQQYSKDVMSLALVALADNEREASRDRSLSEMVRTLDALNVTVGNLFLQVRALEANPSPANRTVLQKPRQVGEVPPGAPAVTVRPAAAPLPPEGFESESPTPGSSPAAKEVQRTAFAERT